MNTGAGEPRAALADDAAGATRVRPPEPWWPKATAVAWIVGVAAGRGIDVFWWWFAVAALGVAAAWRFRRTSHRFSWRAAVVVTLVGLGACWLGLRQVSPGGATLARYLADDGTLAELEGVIVDGPTLVEGTSGSFAAFGYEAPATRFELEVDTIHTADGPTDTAGLLVVSLDTADHRLRLGQRVRCRGWLAPIGPPQNPGDFDYRAFVAERGVVGRLGMSNPGNWDLLEEPTLAGRLWGPASWVTQIRRDVARRAGWALGLGMGDDPQTLGLLQTLLLGDTAQDIHTLRERFREVGLAHILSISGAHLGILMGLVWLLARLIVPHPSRAAVWVLAILGLYLLAVPLRVPIVRASIMAGIFFAGVASGRRPSANTLLALAALVVLVWRPSDLFTAGFQLSFVTVWALLRFVEPVSKTIWPEPLVAQADAARTDFRSWIARRAADYAAVSLVATATAMPLVAYHFQMVNPLAVVLSLLALPVLTAVLALGYLKVLCGLVLPSLALVLSGPLRWAGRVLTLLVEEAAGWPGSALRLVHEVNAGWAAAGLVVAWLWFGGFFRRRKAAGALALGVVIGWGVWHEAPRAGAVLRGDDTAHLDAAASLSMLAVGDGSCFVLRSEGQTLVFDCGSQPYPLIGRRSVVPTLRKMGVKRVDVLVISHADLDHYNGALDLVDALPVGEVWVSADVPEDARAHPTRATAFLLAQLAERGLLPRTVVRGERRRLGGAELEVLWPPREGWEAAKNNDRSVVLDIEVAGRRLRLNGDIQEDAVVALLEANDELWADVTDLPHHGSFVDSSERWLDAVDPAIVLQSTGPVRLRRDRWADLIRDRAITRMVSDRDGMSTIHVMPDATLQTETFRSAAEAPPP
ncbi:MAG: ComEC/Rec2 family competence protein [Planctomycetota bacterium]